MKINFILPEAGLFGGVKATRQLADALVRRGHDVRIIYPTKTEVWPKAWQFIALYRKCRSRLAVWGKPQNHLNGSLAQLVPVKRSSVEEVDVPDADFTIGTWWRTLEWMDGWPLGKGQKVHYVQGNDGWNNADPRIRAVFQKPWLKLVISEFLKRLMENEYGAKHCHLIPNGIETKLFRPSGRTRSHPPQVGFVYSRDMVKDAETAIRALELVQLRMPGVRVVAFGTYGLLDEHRRLRDFQFFLRPLPNKIASIYNSCDCWIMASLSEGFSLPPLEAAACGCPVVCTDCGGPADYVIEGSNGYIVPIRDFQTMADRIISVLSRPEADWIAMSRAATTKAQRFDWDTSALRLESVLSEALK